MKMPGSRSHAGCRDGRWRTPELGAHEPGDHRCEGLHRLARHHDVGAEPPLTRSSKVDERRLLAEAGPTPPAAGGPATGADGRARAVGPPGQARPMTQRGRDQSCQYSTTL
jgi:hypothetical protein